MSRGIDATNQAALAASVVEGAFFCSIETAIDTLYFWSGIGTYSWNGHSWIGVGKLAKIVLPMETVEVQAQGMTLILNGIPSDLLESAIDEMVQGKPVDLWLATFDSAGAVQGNPIQVEGGYVDAVSIDEGGEGSTIRVQVESEFIDMFRARIRRYTDADQQREYPGDLGFEYVAALQAKTVFWGGNPVVTPPPVSGGGDGGGDDDNARYT